MFLKHVEISQIRAIDHVFLDFAGPGASQRQRTVLVGANDAGKSTVLRAIGLALAGSDALGDLIKEPATWVRMGQKEGRINALLATEKGGELAVGLTLKPGWTLRQTMANNAKGLRALDAALAVAPGAFVTLGYGASRRPNVAAPGAAASGPGFETPRSAALASLFSPQAVLVPFEAWAGGAGGGQAAQAAKATASAVAALRAMLKAVLPGVSLAAIEPKAQQVLFKTSDGTLPFGQLSEASQTLVNWCADVLWRIGQCGGNRKTPLSTPGLLLLDEVDLHLHPLRQRTLLDALALALPHLQIVATTQSPMVAQQTREGELAVLERAAPSRGATLRKALGDPSQLTLGQLMAPLFGVDTVDSARVAALRSRARSSPGLLAARDHIELASLAPVQELPAAMQAQLQASTELAEAIARSAGQRAPKLDPAKLRQKMGERIKSATLRAGGAS
jgi:AAA domain, putative AbiEii toxin, Type IV TA system